MSLCAPLAAVLLMLSLSLVGSPVGGMSLQIYNSSTCTPSSLNIGWSFNWPYLGYIGSVTYLDCVINAYTLVSSSPSVKNTSLSYMCSVDASTNTSDFLAYLYSATSTNCLGTRGFQQAQIMINGFNQGECTSVSVLDYTAGQYINGLYAALNCSPSAIDTKPSPNDAFLMHTVPHMALLALLCCIGLLYPLM